ncbi:1789_t:CDS:1, partial [Funneliformis mosseae]
LLNQQLTSLTQNLPIANKMSMDTDNNIEILIHSNDSNILSARVDQIQELMFTFSS